MSDVSTPGPGDGLAFGLLMVAMAPDRTYTERIHIAVKSNPQSPFDVGSPAKAMPESLACLRALYAPMAPEALHIERASDWVSGGRPWRRHNEIRRAPLVAFSHLQFTRKQLHATETGSIGCACGSCH